MDTFAEEYPETIILRDLTFNQVKCKVIIQFINKPNFVYVTSDSKLYSGLVSSPRDTLFHGKYTIEKLQKILNAIINKGPLNESTVVSSACSTVKKNSNLLYKNNLPLLVPLSRAELVECIRSNTDKGNALCDYLVDSHLHLINLITLIKNKDRVITNNDVDISDMFNQAMVIQDDEEVEEKNNQPDISHYKQLGLVAANNGNTNIKRTDAYYNFCTINVKTPNPVNISKNRYFSLLEKHDLQVKVGQLYFIRNATLEEAAPANQ